MNCSCIPKFSCAVSFDSCIKNVSLSLKLWQIAETYRRFVLPIEQEQIDITELNTQNVHYIVKANVERCGWGLWMVKMFCLVCLFPLTITAMLTCAYYRKKVGFVEKENIQKPVDAQYTSNKFLQHVQIEKKGETLDLGARKKMLEQCTATLKAWYQHIKTKNMYSEEITPYRTSKCGPESPQFYVDEISFPEVTAYATTAMDPSDENNEHCDPTKHSILAHARAEVSKTNIAPEKSSPFFMTCSMIVDGEGYVILDVPNLNLMFSM